MKKQLFFLGLLVCGVSNYSISTSFDTTTAAILVCVVGIICAIIVCYHRYLSNIWEYPEDITKGTPIFYGMFLASFFASIVIAALITSEGMNAYGYLIAALTICIPSFFMAIDEHSYIVY